MTTDLVGTTVGQYELREVAHSGGIAALYHGYQPILKRSVAVCILQPDFRDNARFVQAMARGAEIVAAYAHPHIVPILDYGVQDKLNYVVVPVMHGVRWMNVCKTAR